MVKKLAKSNNSMQYIWIIAIVLLVFIIGYCIYAQSARQENFAYSIDQFTGYEDVENFASKKYKDDDDDNESVKSKDSKSSKGSKGKRGALKRAELVMFYAPWCPHCQTAHPEFEAAKEELEANGSKVKLTAIDCVEDENAAKKNNVQGFPTIRYYKNGLGGKYEDYEGGRTKDDFVEFVMSKSGSK